MATVIVEIQLRVVEDEAVRKFYDTTVSAGNDLAEDLELSGVCLNDIIGISFKGQPLDIRGLQDRIYVVAKGIPTAVIFVRKGDPIIEAKNLD